MLKLSEALPATDELLLELIPQYFEPEALGAVVGGREVVTTLLTFPFDFIFLTGSVGVGKVVMRAAAEHLTPALLELGGQNPAIVDETANMSLWHQNEVSLLFVEQIVGAGLFARQLS